MEKRKIENSELFPSECRNISSYTRISKPKIVGSFSIDQNRTFIPDPSNLKYIKIPGVAIDATTRPKLEILKTNLNLNHGYETVQHKPESAHDENLDHILKFIVNSMDNRALFKDQELGRTRRLEVDIVCFRGLLRLIMCTPYEFRDRWTIRATKYRNTIYLCALETPEKKRDRENMTETSKKICSYGFKFEQYVSVDAVNYKHTDQLNIDCPVNEAEEFCCMFESRIEDFNVLFGAEMDGAIGGLRQEFPTDFNNLEFVELKVRLKPNNERQEYNFAKHKLLNWWCQSFLVGINTIHCGLRDNSGIVKNVEQWCLEDVLQRVKSFGSPWSPNVCLNFLNKFLETVRVHMHNFPDSETDCPYSVCNFHYDPASSDKEIKVEYFVGKSHMSFIPQWYIDKLNN